MALLRLALAQMNAVVGDLGANTATLTRLRQQAAAAGADLVVTPELALTGYPPEDLLLKEGFIDSARAALLELSLQRDVPPMLVGTVVTQGEPGVSLEGTGDGRYEGVADDSRLPHIGNGLVALDETGVVASATKRLLPNYDVFDERRYFHPGTGEGVLVNVNGVATGLLICEDVWTATGPARLLADRGATLLVVANASPYARGRQEEREAMLRERALETGCAIAYVNLVGGQDELVFDGHSVVVDARGEVVARATSFDEELLICELDLPTSTTGQTLTLRPATSPHSAHQNLIAPRRDEIAEVYQALVTGTRDYLLKNGFRSAIIALSGGIDSTLVAALAVDAVGSAAVRGFALPSRYSSEHSLSDAYEVARRLDIEIDTISIEEAHVALSNMLTPVMTGGTVGLTDENLQSRIRGVIMMAISNQSGAIVLTTGNKSEMAVGYSTLYGDSAGGFAVIKDVPKTLVYELCRYRNRRAEELGDEMPVPLSVLEKAPSAELRPDQFDAQSLPPYEQLDPLLALYVEEDWTADEMIEAGHDPALVKKITRLVDTAEYKRRQMPPGVRISKKAFGRDRRMPITNGFRPD